MNASNKYIYKIAVRGGKKLVFGKLPIGKRLGALTSALKSGKKINWENFK